MSVFTTTEIIDAIDATAEVADPTYVKFVKIDKTTVRVETKEAEDLDSWPTYHGDFTAEEAGKLAETNGWTVVDSWQTALKLEGWTQPWPRTTLV